MDRIILTFLKKNKYKIITLLISISILLLYYSSIRTWMLDDAFISFRYAKNFSLGNGFTYNIGENVEGYTSFSWVLLLSILNRLNIDTVKISVFLGIIFHICTILLLLFYRKGVSKTETVISALILSSCSIFAVWAGSGMETSLYIFLNTLCILYFEKFLLNFAEHRKIRYLGLLLATLVLTRPEGVLTFSCIFLSIIIPLKSSNKQLKRNSFKQIKNLLIPFAIILLAHLLFRVFYYNDIFPNTYYNKVGHSFDQYIRGIKYSWGFIKTIYPIVLLLIVNILLKKSLSRKKRIILFLFSYIILTTLYIIYVGGDVMPAYRFFSPIIPPLSILAAKALISTSSLIKPKFLFKPLKTRIVLITILILAFNIRTFLFNENLYKKIREDKVAFWGREVGSWLKNNFDQDTVIATNTAGSVPFYSDFETVDMLGLNDKHIARREMSNIGSGLPGHEKTDGPYILDQQPDIIHFGSSLGSIEPIFVSDKEIFHDESFANTYTLNSYELPSKNILYLYIKKSPK